MPSWKKLIQSGSNAHLTNISASGHIYAHNKIVSNNSFKINDVFVADYVNPYLEVGSQWNKTKLQGTNIYLNSSGNISASGDFHFQNNLYIDNNGNGIKWGDGGEYINGTNAGVGSITINTNNSERMKLNESSVRVTGDFEVVGNISASGTQTGSFGNITTDYIQSKYGGHFHQSSVLNPVRFSSMYGAGEELEYLQIFGEVATGFNRRAYLCNYGGGNNGGVNTLGLWLNSNDLSTNKPYIELWHRSGSDNDDVAIHIGRYQEIPNDTGNAYTNIWSDLWVQTGVTSSGDIHIRNDVDGGTSKMVVHNTNSDPGMDKSAGIEFKHMSSGGGHITDGLYGGYSGSRPAGKILARKESTYYHNTGSSNSQLEFYTSHWDTDRVHMIMYGSYTTPETKVLGNLKVTGHISSSNDLVGQQLIINGGTFTSTSLAAAIGGNADNLGDHTAAQNLNMNNYSIVGSDQIVSNAITASDGIYVGGQTFTSASLSTGGSDNLGNHTASKDLRMGDYDIKFNTGSYVRFQTRDNSYQPVLGYTTINNENILTIGSGQTQQTKITTSGGVAVTISGSSLSSLKVGVGVTNPKTKLHVDGTVSASSVAAQSITLNGDTKTAWPMSGGGGSGIFVQSGSKWVTKNDLEITGSLIVSGNVPPQGARLYGLAISESINSEGIEVPIFKSLTPLEAPSRITASIEFQGATGTPVLTITDALDVSSGQGVELYQGQEVTTIRPRNRTEQFSFNAMEGRINFADVDGNVAAVTSSNFGIGTTNPKTKLEVVGNISASGRIDATGFYKNGIEISGGGGTGNWFDGTTYQTSSVGIRVSGDISSSGNFYNNSSTTRPIISSSGELFLGGSKRIWFDYDGDSPVGQTPIYESADNLKLEADGNIMLMPDSDLVLYSSLYSGTSWVTFDGSESELRVKGNISSSQDIYIGESTVNTSSLFTVNFGGYARTYTKNAYYVKSYGGKYYYWNTSLGTGINDVGSGESFAGASRYAQHIVGGNEKLKRVNGWISPRRTSIWNSMSASMYLWKATPVDNDGGQMVYRQMTPSQSFAGPSSGYKNFRIDMEVYPESRSLSDGDVLIFGIKRTTGLSPVSYYYDFNANLEMEKL